METTDFNMDEVVSKITQSVEQKIGESNAAFERRIAEMESRFSAPKEDPLEFESDEDIYKKSTSYADQKISKLEQSQAVTDAIVNIDLVVDKLGFSGEIAPYAKKTAKNRLISLARQNPAAINALLNGDSAVDQMRNDLIDVSEASARREHQKVIQDASHGEHKEESDAQKVRDYQKMYEQTMGRSIDAEKAKRMMEMEG